jgi:hypothetical protein
VAANPLGWVAVAVGATFLVGMFVGIVVMLSSAILRRRGSAVAARLLMAGPAGCLVAASLYVLSLDFFPIVLRVLFVALFLTTAIPVFVWLVRAKISFAPIRQRPN